MTDATPIPRAFQIDAFLPLIGQNFDVNCDPKTVQIKLIEARPGRQRGFDDRPPFTLIFHSSPQILLVDAIYVMKSQNFGPDAIFLSSLLQPPGSEPGYYYQATFN